MLLNPVFRAYLQIPIVYPPSKHTIDTTSSRQAIDQHAAGSIGQVVGQLETREVFGINVEVSSKGRMLWPDAVKHMAVQKIRNEGRSPASIAREIGANDNVVRRWLKDLCSDAPDDQPIAEIEVIAPNCGTSGLARTPSKTFRVSRQGLTIDIPLDADEEDFRRLFSVLADRQ